MISPTSSPRAPRGSRASRRSTGVWSTPSPRGAGSTRSCASGRWRGRPDRTGPTTPKASCSTPLQPEDRRRHVALRARHRRHRPKRRRRPHHGERPDRRAGHHPRRTRTLSAWLLAAVRQLDDAILRLRFNEPDVGTWVLRTTGDAAAVLAAEELLERPRRALAGQRGAVLLGPHVQAPRRVGAHARRARRAGELLRRPARRARPGRRPLVHARRQPRGRRPAAGQHPADRRQRRLVPDGQRAEPAGHAVLGPRRRPRRRTRPASARTCWPPRRPRPASSRSPPTTSTGTTRCA